MGRACTFEELAAAIIAQGEAERKRQWDYHPIIREQLRMAQARVDAARDACYARHTGGLIRLGRIFR